MKPEMLCKYAEVKSMFQALMQSRAHARLMSKQGGHRTTEREAHGQLFGCFRDTELYSVASSTGVKRHPCLRHTRLCRLTMGWEPIREKPARAVDKSLISGIENDCVCENERAGFRSQGSGDVYPCTMRAPQALCRLCGVESQVNLSQDLVDQDSKTTI